MTGDKEKRRNLLRSITDAISSVVIGKEEVKTMLLLGLLSQGNVLIEGLPGTGKTTLARTFARVIGGNFQRVQGTPDMLPSDILGFYLYRPDASATFMPGPIFANVILVDELNRITPRTQAALIEAMQEQRVTIERETHPLEQPFIVVGSQLPHGATGTFPLNEVQIDRFMFRVWSGLPTVEEEDIVLRDIDKILESNISPATTPGEIVKLQQDVKLVHVGDGIRRYIIDIIDSLRRNQDLIRGPSPRGSISLFKGARARALVLGRDFVIPDDVKSLVSPSLSHRLRITAEAEMEDVTPQNIIDKVLKEVPVPKIEKQG
ncbi:AAA family ATPase [Chloroflexota bacterium]